MLKRTLRSIFFIILMAIVLIPVINLSSCKTVNIRRQSIKLIGHRGAGGISPENTLTAIDSGLAEGADFIEIDIRQTKDGEIVVMHDEKVDRTTDGTGKVQDLTLKQIKSFTITAFSNQDSQLKVPLLQEVLVKFKRLNTRLIIEIKNPEDYPGIVERLIAILKKEKDTKNLLVFSFDKESVAKVKAQLPQVITGIFCIGFEDLSSYKNTGASYICPFWASLLYRPLLVEKIHNRDYKILVWTVDQPWAMKYVISKAVDGIITNRPDVFNTLSNLKKQ